MTFLNALNNLNSNVSAVKSDHTEGLIGQMVRLLRLGGDFPVAKGYYDEVKRISSLDDIRPEYVAECLYLEPICAARFLALGNSSRFAGSQTKTNIEAVLTKIGVLRASEEVSGLGTIENLERSFRGRAIALDAYQHLLLTVILADRFYAIIYEGKIDNWSYRQFSTLLNLPLFALSFLKPHLYSACMLDALVEEKGSIERSYRRMMNNSLQESAKQIANQSTMPKEVLGIIELMDVAPWNRKRWGNMNSPEARAGATAAYIAQRAAHAILSFKDSHNLTSVFREVEGKINVRREKFFESLMGIGADYFDTVKLLGLRPLLLPDYLESYSEQIVDEEGNRKIDSRTWPPTSKLLKDFMLEIKVCLNTVSTEGEFTRLPQAVHATLLAFIRALSFDRAVLYRYQKEEEAFKPLLCFGRDADKFYQQHYHMHEISDYSPLKQAYIQERTIFQADPLYDEDWPIVAFPVIWNDEVQAVFYADKKQSKEITTLGTDEQVAVMAISELWGAVPSAFR